MPLPQGAGVVGCPPAACLGLGPETHKLASTPLCPRLCSGRRCPSHSSPLSLSFPPGRDSSEEERASRAHSLCESSLARAGPLPKLLAGPSGPGPSGPGPKQPFPPGHAPFLGRQGLGVRPCRGKLVGPQGRASSGGRGTRLPVTKRAIGTKPRLFSPSAKLGLTLFTLMSPNLLLFQRGSQLPFPGVFGRCGCLLVRWEGGPAVCQCRSEPGRHPTT